jgi:hypothetical protein
VITANRPAQLRTPSQRRTASPRPAPVSTRRPRQTARPAAAATAQASAKPLREAPDADDFGVIWLDCGGRPVAEALGSLVDLATELEGNVTVLDQSSTYAVALVKLPRASFARFSGALMLAGGQVVEGGGQGETAETVFLVSQSGAA